MLNYKYAYLYYMQQPSNVKTDFAIGLNGGH